MLLHLIVYSSVDFAFFGKASQTEAHVPAISPKEGMMEIVLIHLMLIVLGIAAHQWGINSIDGPDSPEWERRQRWYGFH